MPTRGGNPRITIQADAQPVDQAVDQADKALGRLEKAGMRAGASLRTHVGGASINVGSSLKEGLGGVAALAGIGAVGATIGTTLVTGIQGSLDAKDLNAKLTAQLGLTSKESARLGRVAGKLYASNYGDSMEDVNGAIKSVVTDIDGMRTASSSRLKGITGDVIEVSKAFDQDLGGVTRSVGQLMRTGLADNAQEALNIITVGFQAGDDKAGDFLDTLNEYGTQFRKLGIDGQTATGLISQGLKAGARDGDLVADALKEFSIRAVDGSKTTSAGFKAIGLDAAKMSEQIGKGGPAARKGLDVVLDRLRAIKDPVKQSQAAVELFGTQAEDLGKALYALDPSKAVDGLNKVGGAARKVNNELGSTPKQQLIAFKREMEGLAVSAVQKAVPALAHAATGVSTFVKGMKDGTGAGGRFAAAVTDQVQKIKTAISGWVTRNRADIDSVIKAFKTVGTFAKQVFQDTLLPIVRRSFAAIGPIVDGLAHTVRGLVRLVSGLLSGDWNKAWSGAKEAVGGAFKAIETDVKTSAENLWQIIKDLGPKLVTGIVTGVKNLNVALATGIFEGIKAAAAAVPGLAGDVLKGIGHAITSGISKGFGALNPFGDGEGITGSGGFTAISGGNALDGARSILAPFASAAGRFGLHTTSGARPGAITVSGNRSYHADGYAIDESGSPAGMLAYFRYLKATAGSRLRELIYTPGGVGIKDGKPYQYTGAVAAQHMDHVHVAYTGGGIGDGLGQFSATSYGPPWGGIQGGGVTATGVNLKGNPHTYGVAVDPNVIPLGTKLKITPNPFNYSGTFTAFDTGGAIKGKRIDFYDWRGRPAQLGWGVKNVTVSTITGSSTTSSSTAKTKTLKPGISNEPLGSLKVTGQGRSSDPTAELNPTYKPGAPRPIKGYRPNDPIADPVDAAAPEAPDPYDTSLPLGLQAAAALARLTPGTDDDVAADQSAVDYFSGKLNMAAAVNDQQGVAVFGNALADAFDALHSLTDALNQANAIQQQRDELQQTIADNQTKILALGNRTGDLQAQFAAWLSGSIGGRVGLGFQAAGVPGSVARY